MWPEAASTNPTRVLLVEDNLAYAKLVEALLALEPAGGFALTHTASLNTALDTLAAVPFDAVLLDLGLTDSQGLETVARVHRQAASVPIIVLTGTENPALALQAVRLGAQDYLVKTHLDGQLVARVVRHAIERKRIERELHERAEFFRLISENMTDMVAVVDREGTRLYSSPSYRHVLAEPAQLVGTNSFQEIHPDDLATVRRIFQESFATGVGQRAEYRFLFPDGSVRYVESQGNMIRDEAGVPVRLVVVSRDMTERRNVEQEVRELNQRLEERVAERTAQLEAANRELQIEVTERKQIEAALRAEQAKAEQLLLNILPKRIADRLKSGETPIADKFGEVSVLFADLVDFSELTKRTSAAAVVQLLNQIFSAFDNLAERHGLEKIKTIGDAYMVVGGLPEPRADHAEAVAEMALDMQEALRCFNRAGGTDFKMRIGMNIGPVIAGIIGRNKFIYDLWGDTVNVASRMESQGTADTIQVSTATHERLRDKYRFEERGFIPIKGTGQMKTYLLKERNGHTDIGSDAHRADERLWHQAAPVTPFAQPPKA